MADLWVFGRRPSAMVRHRHGGFNATFPMNQDTVVEQAGITRAAYAESLAAEKSSVIEGLEASNVLTFKPRAERGKRGPVNGRPNSRPHPFRE